MSELIEKARDTAHTYGMFPSGAPVVVMVSGGADSVALLRAAASGALGALTISVLHVDHMLRGSESDGDAAFVEELCAAFGVACRRVSVDVGAYAREHGLNLEDAGRRIRYLAADEELDERCRVAGAPAATGRIATAHTLDDRAETTIMRLAQGAGAGGLVSPPYVRGRLVRPLLDCSRADILSYLTDLGQTWREDSTNLDTTRLRARVRAELMPLLRGINPRFDESIARTLTVLGDEDALLERLAQQAAVGVSRVSNEEISLDRAAFVALPRPMQRRVLRMLLRDTFPVSSRLEFDHVEAVCRGAGSGPFARDLPDGLRAFAEYGRLIISRRAESAGRVASFDLAVPGTVEMDGMGRLTAEPGGPDAPPTDALTALVDADALTGPLTVGSTRTGDRMRPFGMRGTRKVSDILIDAKVPSRVRGAVPVVRDGERIVWLAGMKSSEDYRVGPQTSRTVRLMWEPTNPEGDDT